MATLKLRHRVGPRRLLIKELKDRKMQAFKFDVKGMSCGGCTSSVERASAALMG